MAARIICNNYDYINTRGIGLVNQLGWQNITDRIAYLSANLMFKCIHGLAPKYLEDNIDMMCDIIPYNSRSSYTLNVLLPKCNSEFYKRSFKYNGAKIWNALPNFVKESTSKYSFKSNYKLFMTNM